ncbi:MAG: glycosyltransferase family 4 protein [Gammaproteobacteria bacterium]|nr:glycosyltransferase family 4 protein [Gammaproteobacteria bacterium]
MSDGTAASGGDSPGQMPPPADPTPPRAGGLRVLLIAPAPRAGTVQYTHNLANALADRGHRVALATGVGFELAPYPRAYTALELFDRFRPRPLRFAKFLRLLFALRPQVVHLQGAQHPAAYIGLWAMLRVLTGAVFVYTPQDVLPNRVRSYHSKALELLYRRVHHVFLNNRQNQELLAELFQVPASRTSVLPMADLTAFLRTLPARPPALAEGRRMVLCFGLIEARKGIGTLLEAFPEVLARVPDAHLCIVGKALIDVEPYRANCRRLGIEAHVDIRAEYVSFEEMAGYFGRAEVITLPYESGWNSGVLASAYGFGKPVVATTVGGFDEYVNDGVDGLLVPPRDPNALAGAIVRVLTDQPLRSRLRDGVAAASGRYSWAEIARRTETVYAAAIGAARGT